MEARVFIVEGFARESVFASKRVDIEYICSDSLENYTIHRESQPVSDLMK